MEPIDKSSNFTFTPSALFYIFEGRSTLCSSTVRFLTRLYPRRVFNILNSIDRYSRKKERVFGDFLSSERVLSFFIASVVARRCAIVDEINKTLDNRDPPPPPDRGFTVSSFRRPIINSILEYFHYTFFRILKLSVSTYENLLNT